MLPRNLLLPLLLVTIVCVNATAQLSLDVLIDREIGSLVTTYKMLHSAPELSHHEEKTSAFLAQQLRAYGYAVTENLGKYDRPELVGYGVVAVMKNGDGPTILVRSDLDALPVEEKSGLPYSSTVRTKTEAGQDTSVMHACGHDIHITSLLGTAKMLAELKDQWRGTLILIGQPAEELGRGAKAMLADGLFTRFPKPDYGFAAHVGPMAANTMYVKDGTVSSTSQSVEITFKGRGAHGSMPAASIDPIVIGAHFVSDVQTIISREKNPAAFGVVTVGSFQSGTVGNIIPSEALLKLTLRSYAPEVAKLLLDGVLRTAKASADMANAPAPEIKVPGSTASVVNDSGLVGRTSEVMKAAFGSRAIVAPATATPSSASEDFSEFIAAGVPAVFFGIGGTDPQVLSDAKAKGVPVPVNHSPFFAPVPEPAIKTGVAVLTLAVLTVASPDAK